MNRNMIAYYHNDRRINHRMVAGTCLDSFSLSGRRHIVCTHKEHNLTSVALFSRVSFFVFPTSPSLSPYSVPGTNMYRYTGMGKHTSFCTNRRISHLTLSGSSPKEFIRKITYNGWFEKNLQTTNVLKFNNYFLKSKYNSIFG